MNDSSVDVRIAAIRGISNDSVLEDIVKNASSLYVRKAAKNRLKTK